MFKKFFRFGHKKGTASSNLYFILKMPSKKKHANRVFLSLLPHISQLSEKIPASRTGIFSAFWGLLKTIFRVCAGWKHFIKKFFSKNPRRLHSVLKFALYTKDTLKKETLISKIKKPTFHLFFTPPLCLSKTPGFLSGGFCFCPNSGIPGPRLYTAGSKG